MKKVLFLLLVCLFLGNSFGQSLEKEWTFSSIKNDSGEILFTVNSENDFFSLKDGFFEYTLQAKNNLEANGNYILQNELLVLFYNKPRDTIRKYRISQITDSTLVLSENNVQYSFSKRALKTTHPTFKKTQEHNIVAANGLTIKSLWRGILGIFSLLVIAFLCSSNRKAIR